MRLFRKREEDPPEAGPGSGYGSERDVSPPPGGPPDDLYYENFRWRSRREDAAEATRIERLEERLRVERETQRQAAEAEAYDRRPASDGKGFANLDL